jgi:hypothetical protein
MAKPGALGLFDTLFSVTDPKTDTFWRTILTARNFGHPIKVYGPRTEELISRAASLQGVTKRGCIVAELLEGEVLILAFPLQVLGRGDDNEAAARRGVHDRP